MRNLTRAVCLKISAVSAIFFLCALPVTHAVERITYYHTDALGSPTAATDQQGNVVWRETYEPYGERIKKVPASSTNARWHTGHVLDAETGLQYAGARYYDPVLGRFMGTDPKRFSQRDPHSYNRYAYGNNNPYKYVDPDGRDVIIAIARDTYTINSIGGTINVTSDRVQNSFSGYTLENTRAGDNGTKNPITPGTYDSFVRTDHSPNRVELEGVEGYKNIQIHTGNEPVDVKGCIAVGSERSNDRVSDSANSLNKVLGVIEADQRATFGQGRITTQVSGSNSEPPLTIRRLGLDM
jgi:RHS repeat-associated protein